MIFHNPVLLNLSVSSLITNPDGIYVDATFGGGGHSAEILKRISSEAKLLAFDQDADAQINIPSDPRFQFIPQNFKYLYKFLQYYNADQVDGILADLGVSSHQFDTPDRGFSHRFDGLLDMRMNREKGNSACDVINNYPENKLAEIFYQYGEMNNGRKLAQQIVLQRDIQKIDTTTRLVEVVMPFLQFGKENKQLSQIFQAIRIEVNSEMEVLKDFLEQTTRVLKPGGRLVIISYHSLEDRLVKNFMRSGNFEGTIEKDFFGNPLAPFRPVFRKAITPDDEEISDNPRSRSAKLRVAESVIHN